MINLRAKNDYQSLLNDQNIYQKPLMINETHIIHIFIVMFFYNKKIVGYFICWFRYILFVFNQIVMMLYQFVFIYLNSFIITVSCNFLLILVIYTLFLLLLIDLVPQIRNFILFLLLLCCFIQPINFLIIKYTRRYSIT